MPPKIHVIAVAFEKFGQLKVFVQSWLNQSSDNWILTVIHDGLSDEFDAIMAEYRSHAKERIEYLSTKNRFNDYGHSLREIGLQNIKGDYVLLTNADNYYVPRAVEFLNEVFLVHSPDGIIFDMIHSHDGPGLRNLPAYSFFETSFQRASIDMGAAIIKANLASKAGFRDKTFAGDATYFEDIANLKYPESLSLVKIQRVLLVHN
ncbi:glycosyltransferase family 2 protein [Polynucleobacter sp. MG-5-Ahmo-C2]|jgi:hypothetical protein|uniref:glycosyltransferase family A protein n=1 Tax=Polynucleobacter sp. MG-5-Ahmo-C2 TaxID=2081051 RepID=UPI001BFE6436|nr:glycosyltransferase family A protein [Polynucleobacter sp. MG-5-Ahmo-C2]QWD98281.1 glycosyltransferase family 2 protein [Polynucleobacter sp. MG-5-Ahmo-C2]